jgi:hypothetical protein
MASLESILETVDNTQEKIKSFTRVALTENPENVVHLWRDELSRRLIISQDPLPLVYCCNDVLQESKGDTHEALREIYGGILEDELKAILIEKPQLRKQVDKVIKVWADRRVFDKQFISKLKAGLRKPTETREDDDDDEQTTNGNAGDIIAKESDYTDNEKVRDVDPAEIQRAALTSLPVAKLLALSQWVENELKRSTKFKHGSNDDVIKRAEACLNPSVPTEETLPIMAELKERSETLRKRRRCLQGSAPIHLATRIGIEKAIQRVEDSMQHAGEDLNQCEQVDKVLHVLTGMTSSSNLEARYNTVCLIPRRERVIQQVAQGPDLSNSKERVMKEGLTAEAAVKSERPLVYHKGLQKWIPLPSGDDSDNWRD